MLSLAPSRLKLVSESYRNFPNRANKSGNALVIKAYIETVVCDPTFSRVIPREDYAFRSREKHLLKITLEKVNFHSKLWAQHLLTSFQSQIFHDIDERFTRAT